MGMVMVTAAMVSWKEDFFVNYSNLSCAKVSGPPVLWRVPIVSVTTASVNMVTFTVKAMVMEVDMVSWIFLSYELLINFCISRKEVLLR